MKKGYVYRNCLKFLALAAVVLASLASCVKEDRDNCGWTPVTIKVVVTPTTRADIVLESDVESVMLYVFNSAGSYLGSRPAAVNQEVTLRYPDAGSLKVVAVANAKPANEIVSDFTAGCALNAACVSLLPRTSHCASNACVTPSDLFMGDVAVANLGKSGSPETALLPIVRVVGRTKVTVRGLKQNFQTTDEDFSVVVHTNYNAVGFDRVPYGPAVCYHVDGSFLDQRNYTAPAFNKISSAAGENVTVMIYKGSTLLDTVSTDKDGNQLTAKNGHTLNILIDYIASLEVSVVVTPWNEEHQWKEF